MNPYLFIVGCPPSGTTPLRRIIDANRQIAITRETHWIAKRFERRQGVTPDGPVTPELHSWLLSDEKFTRMGIGQDELEGLAGVNPYVFIVGWSVQDHRTQTRSQANAALTERMRAGTAV